MLMTRKQLRKYLFRLIKEVTESDMSEASFDQNSISWDGNKFTINNQILSSKIFDSINRTVVGAYGAIFEDIAAINTLPALYSKSGYVNLNQTLDMSNSPAADIGDDQFGKTAPTITNTNGNNVYKLAGNSWSVKSTGSPGAFDTTGQALIQLAAIALDNSIQNGIGIATRNNQDDCITKLANYLREGDSVEINFGLVYYKLAPNGALSMLNLDDPTLPQIYKNKPKLYDMQITGGFGSLTSISHPFTDLLVNDIIDKNDVLLDKTHELIQQILDNKKTIPAVNTKVRSIIDSVKESMRKAINGAIGAYIYEKLFTTLSKQTITNATLNGLSNLTPQNSNNSVRVYNADSEKVKAFAKQFFNNDPLFSIKTSSFKVYRPDDPSIPILNSEVKEYSGIKILVDIFKNYFKNSKNDYLKNYCFYLEFNAKRSQLFPPDFLNELQNYIDKIIEVISKKIIFTEHQVQIINTESKQLFKVWHGPAEKNTWRITLEKKLQNMLKFKITPPATARSQAKSSTIVFKISKGVLSIGTQTGVIASSENFFSDSKSFDFDIGTRVNYFGLAKQRQQTDTDIQKIIDEVKTAIQSLPADIDTLIKRDSDFNLLFPSIAFPEQSEETIENLRISGPGQVLYKIGDTIFETEDAKRILEEHVDFTQNLTQLEPLLQNLQSPENQALFYLRFSQANKKIAKELSDILFSGSRSKIPTTLKNLATAGLGINPNSSKLSDLIKLEYENYKKIVSYYNATYKGPNASGTTRLGREDIAKCRLVLKSVASFLMLSDIQIAGQALVANPADILVEDVTSNLNSNSGLETIEITELVLTLAYIQLKLSNIVFDYIFDQKVTIDNEEGGELITGVQFGKTTDGNEFPTTDALNTQNSEISQGKVAESKIYEKILLELLKYSK